MSRTSLSGNVGKVTLTEFTLAHNSSRSRKIANARKFGPIRA